MGMIVLYGIKKSVEYRIIGRMVLTTLFFDLDDTLYPPSNGLWEAIRGRISSYMHTHLGITTDQIPLLRQSYLETYGTALRGLQHHYLVDSEDYLAYVHDLPLREYIQPNPALGEMLRSLPQKRWIFTNADDRHAARVLDILGIADCFEGVIDVRRLGFLNKPDIEAHRMALRIAGENDPARCMLLDDSWRNMAPASQLGIRTALVWPEAGTPAAGYHQADFWMKSILDLPNTVPQLWTINHSSG
jgi:putative hydrolase of the HAD superfamily